jgi:hypothetical protein
MPLAAAARAVAVRVAVLPAAAARPVVMPRMIGGFISQFKPHVDPALDYVTYLAEVVKSVADYLAENPAVSQISILGDLKSPGAMDNTMKTVMGLTFSMKDGGIPEDVKKLLAFAITSVLQAMFLRRELGYSLFGVDFNDKKSRDAFIEVIVRRIAGRGE